MAGCGKARIIALFVGGELWLSFSGGAKAVLVLGGLPLPQEKNGARRLLAAPAGGASGLASSVFSLRQSAR